MSIENFYTTAFTTNRLKTDQTAYQSKLTGKYCHIQQEGGSPIELQEGAFYSMYNMWCAIMDIDIGDQVVIGTDTYQVKEVKTFNMGGNPHMEILLALGL